MKVRCIQEYFDRELDRTVYPEEVIECSKERANILVAYKVKINLCIESIRVKTIIESLISFYIFKICVNYIWVFKNP